MFVDDKYYLPKRTKRGILEDYKSYAREMGLPKRKKGFFAWLFGW